MNREYQDIVGSAIDAAAGAMRPGDAPIPLHVIQAVVDCTMQECSHHIGKMATSSFDRLREGLKVDSYLGGVSDGLDDAAWELLKLCGVVIVVDSEDD